MKSTILSTLFVLAATLGAASAAHADWAQDKYEQLQSRELYLQRTMNGGPIVGADVNQKDDPNGGFCRKITAVAPNAKPSFACYSEALNGNEARSAFNGSARAPFNVMFYVNNSPVVGSSWAEKFVSNPDLGELLCVRTMAVAPKAKPSFECYSDRPRVGGGISVGN